MADPLTQLAPPAAPPAPTAAAVPTAAVDALWATGTVLLALVALALLALWWWRWRWPRALRGVLGEPSPSAAAERLVRLARHHAVQAPAAWWFALDTLRFARPAPEHARWLARLLAEAESFEPRDRLLRRRAGPGRS